MNNYQIHLRPILIRGFSFGHDAIIVSIQDMNRESISKILKSHENKNSNITIIILRTTLILCYFVARLFETVKVYAQNIYSYTIRSHAYCQSISIISLRFLHYLVLER